MSAPLSGSVFMTKGMRYLREAAWSCGLTVTEAKGAWLLGDELLQELVFIH